MKKILGILGLLVFVCVATALLSDRFLTEFNIENLIRRSALFGIISIGAAFVIITGGIDLSIGSVVCLVGCLFPWMLVEQGLSPPTALAIVAIMSLGIGLSHGLLITKLRLQPFVVTLCGLLIYRGLTRGIVNDQTQGFRGGYTMLRNLSQGQIPLPGTEFGIPNPCLILAVVTVAAAFFLNYTVYGRYLLALGRNEEATRFSGINTQRMVIVAYVICAALSGLGGLLFVLDVGSAQPVDFGSFYELYAIAAAVLGGCSLRGGEGTVLGVVIGAAVMQVLRNSITLIDWIPTNIEYAVIGAVILGGTIVDEVVRRLAAARKAPRADAKDKREDS
ncbi:MAG: sugar ABC transporter permease [Pirellulaceae bacterium]|nr:MAG: sugar ABC transporter permease [Pirellulaceae bacterium]